MLSLQYNSLPGSKKVYPYNVRPLPTPMPPRFNMSMISRIAGTKTGCGSCGK